MKLSSRMTWFLDLVACFSPATTLSTVASTVTALPAAIDATPFFASLPSAPGK
jgi:hypothetical protein